MYDCFGTIIALKLSRAGIGVCCLLCVFVLFVICRLRQQVMKKLGMDGLPGGVGNSRELFDDEDLLSQASLPPSPGTGLSRSCMPVVLTVQLVWITEHGWVKTVHVHGVHAGTIPSAAKPSVFSDMTPSCSIFNIYNSSIYNFELCCWCDEVGQKAHVVGVALLY